MTAFGYWITSQSPELLSASHGLGPSHWND